MVKVLYLNVLDLKVVDLKVLMVVKGLKVHTYRPFWTFKAFRPCRA